MSLCVDFLCFSLPFSLFRYRFSLSFPFSLLLYFFILILPLRLWLYLYTVSCLTELSLMQSGKTQLKQLKSHITFAPLLLSISFHNIYTSGALLLCSSRLLCQSRYFHSIRTRTLTHLRSLFQFSFEVLPIFIYRFAASQYPHLSLT